MSVTIPKDERGYIGRECPEPGCEGYFKVKPGTGLTGSGTPCHCPYCGYAGPTSRFWTKEQIEYGKSIALRRVQSALHENLKAMEFSTRSSGPFGISMSLKVKGGTPAPIRHYRERDLETDVTCSSCTLQYSVYGLFAFCPDCGQHNSLQILHKNLDLVMKMVKLAEGVPDGDVRGKILDDALAGCVAALDGFGREACRVRSAASATPDKCGSVSFQNLDGAAKNLNQLFGVDIKASVGSGDWQTAQRGFMKRHVLAHRSGVVDQKYVEDSKDAAAVVGRRITVSPSEVCDIADATRRIGEAVILALPPIK